MPQPLIAVAGASGDLGGRITQALLARGARVVALLRPDASAADRDRVSGFGASPRLADPRDVYAMAKALEGVSCVVSALNGLSDVIIDRQSVLVDAAVQAGVPRFIPSDFSEDFTKTSAGRNRNLDLRKAFMRRIDASPLRATTILNGAFMDMLGAEMPVVQPGIRRVLYWHDADQVLDFTTKDDVAAYTAAAALDDTTPRILRIAGESLSAKQLAATLSEASGKAYKPQWVGSLGTLGATIKLAQWFSPGKDEVFPAWQGMQYMRDMFSGQGRLFPLDTDRYADLRWTRVAESLAARGVAL